jgi:hypothetical protein
LKKPILLCIAIIGSLFILIRGCQYVLLTNAINVNNEISRLDTNSNITGAPKEYLSLFKNKKDFIANTYSSKHRYFLSQFKNEDASIQVLKLDTIGHLSLKDILNETFTASKMSMYAYYSDYFPNKYISINYQIGVQEKVNSLYFTLNGEKNQIIQKNDSLVYYYSIMKDFSIKYRKESKVDIYGEVTSRAQGGTPVEIMFLKRNGNLYFLILFTNDNINLDQYALYNLIFGRKYPYQ